MSERPKMFCKLKRWYDSGDGDFIPEGMIVEVLGWATDCTSVTVRTEKYMYADSFGTEPHSDDYVGCVGAKYILDVRPDDLIYVNIN